MSYSSFPKVKPFPWYIRFLLLFRKPHYSYDFGALDRSCMLTVKQLFGKIYILDSKIVATAKGPNHERR